ncbi:MAG: type II secretion system protein GspJ [Pseudomonadota bacterium]
MIELVVAMAVFALVAVMGLQALSGTMRLSERLTELDTETAELGKALALMRNDLASIVPMLFYPPQSVPQSSVAISGDGRLGLSLAGQPGLSPRHTDRHRAVWRVDAGTGGLVRQFWPTLIPAEPGQLSRAMPVLANVTDLRLRTFWPSIGWVEGATPPLGASVAALPRAADGDAAGPPPAAYFSTLPLAIEVTFQTARYGEIRLVERLR